MVTRFAPNLREDCVQTTGKTSASVARILPIWEKLAGTVPVGDETLVIADYGSSQGRNSMAPMRIAIAALRAKSASGRTVHGSSTRTCRPTISRPESGAAASIPIAT